MSDVRKKWNMMSDVRKNGKWKLGYTIRRDYGPTPVARGGSGAKAPPLAARPVAGHFPQKSN